MLLTFTIYMISLLVILSYLVLLYQRTHEIDIYQSENIDFNSNIHSKKLNYIPKKIFQLIPDKNKIHPDFQKNIDYIKKLNPDWEYTLMDDEDIMIYMKKYYPDLLPYYNRINPKYGAARADFFRYLLIFREGGAYFDIKSATSFPLTSILREDDEYIISHFCDEVHKHYLKYPYGEFQNWHIISKPNHPFLKATIEKVIKNIIEYDVNVEGTGKGAVLKVTGPIAYTQAIIPILDNYNYREAEMDEMIGLVYNNLPNLQILPTSHVNLFSKTHYSMIDEPVILSN
jgi:mannosyltransferase OCH1-like enzyme